MKHYYVRQPISHKLRSPRAASGTFLVCAKLDVQERKVKHGYATGLASTGTSGLNVKRLAYHSVFSSVFR